MEHGGRRRKARRVLMTSELKTDKQRGERGMGWGCHGMGASRRHRVGAVRIRMCRMCALALAAASAQRPPRFQILRSRSFPPFPRANLPPSTLHRHHTLKGLISCRIYIGSICSYRFKIYKIYTETFTSANSIYSELQCRIHIDFIKRWYYCFLVEFI